MNIYDKRQVKCITCGSSIGEVDSDAVILFTRCGRCSSSGENEIFDYITQRFQNTIKNVIVSH